VGDRWNPQSHEIKDFLARNQIPYRWLDVERSEEARNLAGCVADAKLPLVLFPEGEPLHQPSTTEVASRIGLQTTADKPFYDLAIVGGGPAGLAAAVYGASEGLNTVLIEREAPAARRAPAPELKTTWAFRWG
jgi:thioredoxin reductase (NADPH)